jgi:hypothetical protein
MQCQNRPERCGVVIIEPEKCSQSSRQYERQQEIKRFQSRIF